MEIILWGFGLESPGMKTRGEIWVLPSDGKSSGPGRGALVTVRRATFAWLEPLSDRGSSGPGRGAIVPSVKPRLLRWSP